MKLLLNYYHPVIIDLAMTFQKLGFDVTVSYNTSIKDHYGDWINVLTKNASKYQDFKHVPLTAALQLINGKQFDLVGCDGVFSGDELVLAKCKEKNIKWFCINGYPYQTDEPSENILAFSWFLPQIRYLQKYQGENGVKNIDWKNIAEKGESDEKNICVFYPNFWELKEWIQKNCVDILGKNINYWGFGSYIQRFEECNKWNYEVFKKIKSSSNEVIENFQGLPQELIYEKMRTSKATLHCKAGDCPGISIMESLLIGCPIITMRSFVLASFNQELLIHGVTAFIADDVNELIQWINSNEWQYYKRSSAAHIQLLTDWQYQKPKLERFIQKCLK